MHGRTLRTTVGVLVAALAAVDSGRAQSTDVVHSEADARGARMLVDARGEIRLNGEGTVVRAISPGGWLIVEETRAGSVRRLEARPAAGGVAVSVFRDGVPAEPGADDRAWIRRAVLYAAREGVGDVHERVAALRARGGAGAVLAEIGQLRGEGMRASYYAALLRTPLAPAEGRRVLARALDEVRGDGDRRALLQSVIESPQTGGEVLAGALRATRTLSSPGDHAHLLHTVARRDGALRDDAVLDAFFAGVGALESEADRRWVLVEIAPGTLRDPRVRRAVAAAARALASEADRREVLAALARAEG